MRKPRCGANHAENRMACSFYHLTKNILLLMQITIVTDHNCQVPSHHINSLTVIMLLIGNHIGSKLVGHWVTDVGFNCCFRFYIDGKLTHDHGAADITATDWVPVCWCLCISRSFKNCIFRFGPISRKSCPEFSCWCRMLSRQIVWRLCFR